MEWNSQDLYSVAVYLSVCAVIFVVPAVYFLLAVILNKNIFKGVSSDNLLKHGMDRNEIVYVSTKNWTVIYKAVLCVAAVSVIVPRISFGDRFGVLDVVGLVFLVVGSIAAIAIYYDYWFGICVCSKARVVLRSPYTMFRFVSIPTETLTGCRYMGGGRLKSIDIVAGRKTYTLFNIENRESLIEFITAAATKTKQAAGGNTER